MLLVEYRVATYMTESVNSEYKLKGPRHPQLCSKITMKVIGIECDNYLTAWNHLECLSNPNATFPLQKV